ncbi:D-xylose ABC transporter substrate-binding protein (plasmid) [Deinococcus psychrotolerans]|uniref:D-xylose ABC transporter substrate-binding protein n=1 Tax=Deinococcus psychrotolerans TaxID=2489213 RepID=A0A3G8YHV3_9DEIO|nr:D-xylose ABC transporter substrate-binding protein [Deinococcus psychrotolerans]AZI44545.1 D-xylose ABC transporter substrate-binding protein [Deinococcus psychrotolerans]
MKRLGILSAVLGLSLLASSATAQKQVVVGVSWSNFQEERWKTDEAAIKTQLDKMGAKYLSADAQSSNEKQLSDIESLVTRGATVLIVLAQDSEAVLPAITKAKADGIPVVSYDRLIEDPWAFYISFDNKEVGRLQARMILGVKPKGNYAFIKGSPSDPNAALLYAGQLEVLDKAIKSGAIKNVGNQFTEGWKPEVAQTNMEQILTANQNKVDAVVASNDGTAGGAVAALASVGLAGKVPISGQDADKAALNRIARGLQTGTVWKDSRTLGTEAAKIAVQLANGAKLSAVMGSGTFNGGPKKVTVNSILLKPVVITRSNLGTLITAKWATKAEICNGVTGTAAPVACK